MKNGFTLVELLIVIALIAILSVAVLATINPIEQANKARDASVQNDAAEVLNAYERYYASRTSYPWMDVMNGTIASVDLPVYLRSFQIGFGLCGAAAPTSPGQVNSCDSAVTPGSLISTQELKDSFLSKPYTTAQGAASYSFQDNLYLVKMDAANGNSIYVCYVPRAKANRTPPATATWKMKALDFAGSSENAALPTTIRDATVGEIGAAKYATLLGVNTSTSTAGADTLFRCVP